MILRTEPVSSPSTTLNLLSLAFALFLVALNGFFVAAEFALVKVRISRIKDMQKTGKPFSKTALWLAERLDASLSVCQLGITMASLGLGWVGEPAFAKLLEPAFANFGVTSPTVIHGVSFVIAFTLITALHLVVGEQVPKIFAIRRPEQMLLWSAPMLKFFYVLGYPFMITLNWITGMILGWLGVGGAGGHDTPHTQEEIRALLEEAHIYGDVTRNERSLIDAVFEFDDTVCRRVMVPRADVDILTTDLTMTEVLAKLRRSKHTRFPLCEDSFDDVIGVIHIKDLISSVDQNSIDLKKIARPPKVVSENMPISKLLRHFQATRQHMAFVVDEFGNTIGIVTLENVLEQIVGPVADEFDMETPHIVPDGPGQYIVQGSTPIGSVSRLINLPLDNSQADTFSGLLTANAGEILGEGDQVQLGNGVVADILEVKGSRAITIRVTVQDKVQDSEALGHA